MTLPMAVATILVVDDDLDVRIYASAVLEDAGYRVVCAEDGNHGLMLAEAERPAIICMDVSMPHCSGVRMYRRLKRHPILANVPVVMVTGLPKVFERFIKSRRSYPAPEGYLPKPFAPAQLLHVVRAILLDRQRVN